MSDLKIEKQTAISSVLQERIRQDETWGEQNHSPTEWLPILMEEVGEFSKAILENSNIREEAVQVAAVALSIVESIDRNSK